MTPRIPKTKRVEVQIGSGLPPLEELQYVVWALNGDEIFAIEGPAPGEWELHDKLRRETPKRLHRLVESWNHSGRNLSMMWQDSYVRVHYVDQLFEKRPLRLAWTGLGTTDIVHTFLDRHGSTPDEEAARFFLTLILNPQKDKLRGPCPRCGRYYIRRTARNTKYCIRSCGTRSTAIEATKRKRAEERADKLQRARKACELWRKQRRNGQTKKDWKEFVSATEPDITANFLTRAVKNGELEAPVSQ